jgi:hypothetical protein
VNKRKKKEKKRECVLWLLLPVPAIVIQAVASISCPLGNTHRPGFLNEFRMI